MTALTSSLERGIKRCAVCKIDLRGRFVLVNDEAEKLLGLGKDELFGRPFAEFLDEEDQQTIQQILRQRNHYESFFETTSLILRNRDGLSIPVRLILSLNYINGNPVNYQIVIQAESDLQPRTDASIVSLASYLTLQLPDQWQEMTAMIGATCQADAVALYFKHETNGLPLLAEPVAAWSFDRKPKLLLAESIHHAVAETGIAYDCTCESDVRQLISRNGTAPHELILPLASENGDSVVIRLIYSETTPAETIRGGRKQLERMLLAVGLRPSSFESELPVPAAAPVEQAVLSSTLLATAAIDSRGQLSDCSAPFRITSGCDFTGAELSALLLQLGGDEAVDTAGPVIRDAIRRQVPVTLEAGPLLLSFQPDHREGGQIVLLEQVHQPSTRRKTPSQLRWQYARSVVHQLDNSLDALSTMSDSLLHRFHGNLSGDGELLLLQQAAQVRKVRDYLGDIGLLAESCIAHETPAPVDCGLLLQQQIAAMTSKRKELHVEATIPRTEQFNGPRKTIATITDAILGFFIDRSAHQLRLRAAIEQTERQICLSIVADQFPISQRQLQRAFQGHRTASDQSTGYLSLAAATMLAQHMGGELGGQIVSANEQQGLLIRLTIPTSAA